MNSLQRLQRVCCSTESRFWDRRSLPWRYQCLSVAQPQPLAELLRTSCPLQGLGNRGHPTASGRFERFRICWVKKLALCRRRWCSHLTWHAGRGEGRKRGRWARSASCFFLPVPSHRLWAGSCPACVGSE